MPHFYATHKVNIHPDTAPTGMVICECLTGRAIGLLSTVGFLFHKKLA